MAQSEQASSLAQHVRPLEAGAHVVVASVLGEVPAIALAWTANGARLLFGLESGEAGFLNLPA
jgi:hypothetical protein